MSFSGYDTFKVIKKYKGDIDNYSLTNLYMPLIGVDSYSMYNILTKLGNDEYMFSKLMDHINIGSGKFLEETFNKLEGIGLLETYQNKEGSYIFLLNQPVSYNEFMSNHILVEFLKGKIGLTEFNKLLLDFDLKGYKNITHGFDEVYERTNKNIKSIISPYFKSFVNNIQVKNDKFDYTYFKLMFDHEVVSDEILELKEVKEEILRISFQYNLNEEEMYDAVMMEVRINKDLNLKEVLKYARKLYENKGAKQINFKTKEADPFIYDKVDDDTAQLISLLDTMSASDLLTELSGIKASTAELKMIDDLQRNTGFSQGVINFMVLLVTNEKNGEIPSYNYFEKIASTWKRAKINNTLDALNYVSEKSKKEDNKTISYKKKTKPTPEWYSDYEKNLKNSKTNQEQNEKIDLDEVAKDLFSGD